VTEPAESKSWLRSASYNDLLLLVAGEIPMPDDEPLPIDKPVKKGKKKSKKGRALKYSEDQERVPAGEPGGGEFGSTGSGGGDAAQRAADMHAAAKEAEPQATATLHESLGAHGSYLLDAQRVPGGLALGRYDGHGVPKAALKDEGKLEGKIGRVQDKVEAETGRRPDAVTASHAINDPLRYTAIADKEHYTEATKAAAQALVDAGYRFIPGRSDNTWENYQDRPYRGINTVVRAPNGSPVEVQFHTPESWDVKENQTHAPYEEWRQTGANAPSPERMAELHSEMLAATTALGDSPPGAEELTPEYFGSLRPTRG
jgi:hypothetical protein